MNSSTPLIDKNQILLIDKPAGLSSFGVVARVRHHLSHQTAPIPVVGKDGVTRLKYRKIKVGHTGTLDPFATGLLILLLGSGTKQANSFLKLDKTYLADIRLGATSTTGDPEGTITPHSVQHIPTLAEVQQVLTQFTGAITQRVPNFSAVKIHGQRAYKLARAGQSVEMPVRTVQIYQLELLSYIWPNLRIRCHVSSGTYIRTLGEDIGTALHTGAYLTALRRTQVGDYRITDALTLDQYLSTSNLPKKSCQASSDVL